MKKSRFTGSRIFSILNEYRDRFPIAELCRKHGMSEAGFHKIRAGYSVWMSP
jgi:putative transposase